MNRNLPVQCLICLMAVILAAAVCFGQQTVTAERYVVASGHELATRAGLDVLEAGGNAMDAAVAVSMCLGVTEPHASGLGGKLVMLYYDAESGTVSCVEALCVSPIGLDVEGFKALDRDERVRGYQSVAVPGMPAGLHAAFERWGSGEWADLIEPAARLAEDGVPLCEKTLTMFEPKLSGLRADPEAARLFLVDGELPATGTVLKQPELAATLRLIGREGPAVFYEGELAQQIVSTMRAHGSPMTLDDFKAYRPNFPEPLSVSYAGATVYSSPPPLTGGVTLLMTLQALADCNWAGCTPRGEVTIHRVSSVLRGVYPQVTRDIGDHPDAHARALTLLDPNNTRDIYLSALGEEPGEPVGVVVGVPDDASTTHFVIKDAQGNWASVTQSLSNHFGACVAVPGTGILLNNSMSNFALLSPDSVNRLAPGKRPRSTVAPVMVLRNGEPVLALGIPGGQRIPTTSVQLLMDMLVFGVGPAESFDLPRYHIRRSRNDSEPHNAIDLEAGTETGLTEALHARGWSVTVHERDGTYFGGGNAVVKLPDGRVMGVADQRRTNFADGQ